MEYSDHTFLNQDVRMAGHTFNRCTFSGCRLIVDGTEAFHMSKCIFVNPKLHFEGPAANTISFLSAMYGGAGEGGRQLIRDVFRNHVEKGQ